MKAEVKAEWVAALRSGEYPQGQEFLRTDEGYCCLGVLCDIYQKSRTVGTWQKIEEERCYSYLGSRCFLPDVVEKWSELVGTNILEDQQLAYRNDHGHTFNQIADYIEESL